MTHLPTKKGEMSERDKKGEDRKGEEEGDEGGSTRTDTQQKASIGS